MSETRASDGRPMYIQGKQLINLMHARHSSALVSIRRALAGGVGIGAACELLGVGREVLRRHGKNWPELAEILANGAMPLDERSSLGGVAGSAARWGKRKAKASTRG